MWLQFWWRGWENNAFIFLSFCTCNRGLYWGRWIGSMLFLFSVVVVVVVLFCFLLLLFEQQHYFVYQTKLPVKIIFWGRGGKLGWSKVHISCIKEFEHILFSFVVIEQYLSFLLDCGIFFFLRLTLSPLNGQSTNKSSLYCSN